MNYKEKNQLSVSLVVKAEKKLEKRLSSAKYLLKQMLQPGNVFEYRTGYAYSTSLIVTKKIIFLELLFLKEESTTSFNENTIRIDIGFKFFDFESNKIRTSREFLKLKTISKDKAGPLKLLIAATQ